jgi:hypothetical protein
MARFQNQGASQYEREMFRRLMVMVALTIALFPMCGADN